MQLCETLFLNKRLKTGLRTQFSRRELDWHMEGLIQSSILRGEKEQRATTGQHREPIL